MLMTCCCCLRYAHLGTFNSGFQRGICLSLYHEKDTLKLVAAIKNIFNYIPGRNLNEAVVFWFLSKANPPFVVWISPLSPSQW